MRRRIQIDGSHQVSVFRKCQNFYLRAYCANLDVRNVLNTGAQQGSKDKEGNLYESYFPGADFFTLDLEGSVGSHHFKADLLNLNTIPMQFDLVLLMSVIEHVRNPFKMGEELLKITHEGSYIYVAAPFFYPVHKGGSTEDYWRFTPQAIGEIFYYCDTLRLDYYPTVVRTVDDRPSYWNDENATFTGFSTLLRRSPSPPKTR